MKKNIYIYHYFLKKINLKNLDMRMWIKKRLILTLSIEKSFWTGRLTTNNAIYHDFLILIVESNSSRL